MRQAHQRWWSRYRGGFGLRENRAPTSSSSWSSWRLSWSPWQSSLLSSLSLPCLPRGVGWLDECADAANQRARAVKLTRNQQKLYHVRLTRVLERCSLAIMSSADVAPTRGLRDINDGADDAPQFVDSHRWQLELDLLGDI